MKEQKWGKNNNFYYIPNLEHHCCTVYKVSFFVSKNNNYLVITVSYNLKTLQAVIINKVEFLTYEHRSYTKYESNSDQSRNNFGK